MSYSDMKILKILLKAQVQCSNSNTNYKYISKHNCIWSATWYYVHKTLGEASRVMEGGWFLKNVTHFCH